MSPAISDPQTYAVTYTDTDKIVRYGDSFPMPIHPTFIWTGGLTREEAEAELVEAREFHAGTRNIRDLRVRRQSAAEDQVLSERSTEWVKP